MPAYLTPEDSSRTFPPSEDDRPRHTRTMVGRPLRRARAAADANGEPGTFRLPRAGISPVAWRDLSPVEKLQALYGLSLDAALEPAPVDQLVETLRV